MKKIIFILIISYLTPLQKALRNNLFEDNFDYSFTFCQSYITKDSKTNEEACHCLKKIKLMKCRTYFPKKT